MKIARLLGFALHLAAGFAAAAAFPLLPAAARPAIVRAWSRGMLAVLGVRLRIEGDVGAGPALLVANHVSWLDVLAISALRPVVFVCKAEIAAWPGIGWLLARVGTIFMRRGSARGAARASSAAAGYLGSRVSVGVFPEGTSTDGEHVLPFNPALFQAAIDAACPVQPLALSYSSKAAVYAGAIGFGESLAAIAGARELRVTLSVLPPLIRPENRRDAAARAYELIALRVRAGTFTAESGHAPQPQGRLVVVQGGHPGLV